MPKTLKHARLDNTYEVELRRLIVSGQAAAFFR
jgi:hypothetical protein